MRFGKHQKTQEQLPLTEPFPWKTRAANIEQSVDEYVKTYKNMSTIWLEAVRDGWDSDLRNYIHAVAQVQAQLIHGEKNIGWDGVLIFGSGANLTEGIAKHFLHEQHQQAETGRIDVPIPTGRIAEWKAMAEYRRKGQAESSGNIKTQYQK